VIPHVLLVILPGWCERERSDVIAFLREENLKREGIPPSRERPTTWRTFVCAHWPALVAGDFFTTGVWTSALSA
jgi:hypothetical protein